MLKLNKEEIVSVSAMSIKNASPEIRFVSSREGLCIEFYKIDLSQRKILD